MIVANRQAAPPCTRIIKCFSLMDMYLIAFVYVSLYLLTFPFMFLCCYWERNSFGCGKILLQKFPKVGLGILWGAMKSSLVKK